MTQYVPYQKCPICNGEKQNYSNLSQSWFICDTCQGKGIIPMHVLPDESVKVLDEMPPVSVFTENPFDQ